MKKDKQQDVWGVSIDESSIRVACVRSNGDRYEVVERKSWSVDSQAYWDRRWDRIFAPVITMLQGKRVVLAVSDEHILYSSLVLPSVSGNVVEQMITSQAEVLTAEYQTDFEWTWFTDTKTDDTKNGQQVVLAGMRQKMCEQIKLALSGFASDVVIVPESVATLGLAGDLQQDTAVRWVNENYVSCVFVSNGVIQTVEVEANELVPVGSVIGGNATDIADDYLVVDKTSSQYDAYCSDRVTESHTKLNQQLTKKSMPLPIEYLSAVGAGLYASTHTLDQYCFYCSEQPDQQRNANAIKHKSVWILLGLMLCVVLYLYQLKQYSLSNLQTQVKNIEASLEPYGGTRGVTAMQDHLQNREMPFVGVMGELSRIIGKDQTIFTRIQMGQKGILRLHGMIRSVPELNKLVDKLSKSQMFNDVRVNRVSENQQQGKQEFEITLSLVQTYRYALEMRKRERAKDAEVAKMKEVETSKEDESAKVVEKESIKRKDGSASGPKKPSKDQKKMMKLQKKQIEKQNG
ncbi:PilN domain-containing protein [Planctomycetota bacterium]|nr:PilN domain-containing protein [Planctomycetota bacterium]